MTLAELALLEQVAAFLIQAIPHAAVEIANAIQAFRKGQRPELGAPPAADTEAAINAAVDAELAQLAPAAPTPPLGPDEGPKL